MARNGSGTMSIDYADFQSGANIVADELDANFSTIVAEITNSVALDGQSTMSGDLAMGTNKITGVGDPTSAQDVVTKAYFEANASAGGGGLQSMQVFTASGTWTKPADINLVKVTVVGGGGGGGSAMATSDLAAGGGAGGGTAIEVIDVSGISSETITIGAGGAGGTGGGVGSDGGTTSFGSHCSATGGEGGLPNNTSEKQFNEGGIGVGGDLNLKGSPGTSRITNSSATGGEGAHGGASFLGGGAPGKNTNSGENTPFSGTVGYGGGGQGGGGGNNVNSAWNGSAGGAGIIIVEEYA